MDIDMNFGLVSVFVMLGVFIAVCVYVVWLASKIIQKRSITPVLKDGKKIGDTIELSVSTEAGTCKIAGDKDAFQIQFDNGQASFLVEKGIITEYKGKNSPVYKKYTYIADSPSVTLQDINKTLGLVLISAANNGEIMPVKDGDILGREHVGKDLFVRHSMISRRHAKIIYSEGEWMIEDIGSKNGTYVNGNKLKAGQKHSLKTMDIVALSETYEFLVKIEV